MAYRRDCRWVAFRLAGGLAGFVSLGVLAGCPQIDSQMVRDRAIGVAEAAKDFRTGGDKYLFIDARTADEYAKSRIPRARHMDPWNVDIHDPDPAFDEYKELIIYGQNPGTVRAEALVKRFYHAKQDHARLLEGGLDAWTKNGNPVEQGPPPSTK
ncbi:MAG TPA: rhodanese-like domain-containing protein [Phycisphaerales bacterium]|nr:rhodanese-like domain-containing protein [Phycisphaerales bacterium]